MPSGDIKLLKELYAKWGYKEKELKLTEINPYKGKTGEEHVGLQNKL